VPGRPTSSATGRLRRWFLHATARRPTGWIGQRTYGGPGGAPKAHEAVFKKVLEWLGPLEGERCLEIGCGGGALTEKALGAGANSVACLDHSPDMLALTMARNREALAREALQVKLGDAAEIPWPDHTFTAAFSANSFFFFDQPQQVLAELFRVLAPGSRLVIATAPGPLPRPSPRFWWVWVWGSDLKVYTEQEMRAMYERAGFADIRLETTPGLQLSCGVRPG
jgi:SAM-dependent methyltransferase